MREYIVEYKQKHEDFVRHETFQADFMNEALQKFLDNKTLVTESLNIKEYETPYTITVKYEDEEETYTYHRETFADLMNMASKMEAFDDCAPRMEIFEVEAEGVRIIYDGWLSGMRYRWRAADTGEVVWDECYMEWDH